MSELKPGRELDALIAEKVMSRAIVTYEDGYNWRIMPGTPLVTGDKYINIGTGILMKISRYSTDMRATWEVVEKLKGRYFRLAALRSPSDDTWSGFMCAIGNPNTQVCAKTAPLAICLAALKTLEETK